MYRAALSIAVLMLAGCGSATVPDLLEHEACRSIARDNPYDTPYTPTRGVDCKAVVAPGRLTLELPACVYGAELVLVRDHRVGEVEVTLSQGDDVLLHRWLAPPLHQDDNAVRAGYPRGQPTRLVVEIGDGPQGHAFRGDLFISLRCPPYDAMERWQG